MTNELFSSCPVCDTTPLAADNEGFRCSHCGLTVKPKRKLFGRGGDKFTVTAIGEDYDIARQSIVGQTFTRPELAAFHEHVYRDAILADFADGNFEKMNMPESVLAQILLEQLRETCFLHVDDLRRAHGPALEPGGNRFPSGKVPVAQLTWKDDGNLFLTNVRLVFPSHSFTFIRMGRKMVGMKTFENGVAIQLKGEDHATYFVGCAPHQAALMAAYIQGKVAGLREATA